MTFSPYAVLLRRPAVRNLLLLAVLARVPHTAAGVVLTLHVVLTLDRGYLAAGLVGAATTIGIAIGAPWRGRVVDRLGLRRALVPSVVAEAVVWTSAPFLSYGWLLAASVVGGLLALPVFTVVRQSLAVLAPPGQRRSAYALDSVGVELSFVTGPALGAVVATQVSTTLALVGVGVTAVLAGLALMAQNPPTRSTQLPAYRQDDGAVTVVERAVGRRGWVSPALLLVLGATAGATVVLAGTDVAVVAALESRGATGLIGLVLGAWGVGSIVGGLLYGGWSRSVHPLWLLLGLGLLTAPIGLAGHSIPVLCATIAVAGLLCAPAISATAEAVAALVPEHVRGEAMGWHGSALTVGSALGAPVAGTFIDGVGPGAGFGAVGAAGAVLALVGLGVQRLGSRPARLAARAA